MTKLSKIREGDVLIADEGQEVIDVTKELIDLARNVGGLDDDWLGSRTPLEVWSLIREYRVQARKILDQIE